MKFFWKLFFSIILVTEFFVGVSGYVLIYSSFRNSVEQEVEAAYRENDMLCFSLNQGVANSVEMSSMSLMWGIEQEDGEADYKEILTKALTIQTTEGEIPFCLTDSEGEPICGSRKNGLDDGLVKKLNMQQRGYEIRKVEGRYMIHCARPVKLLNEDYYIENYRDITEVFANQAGYARTFSIIMGLLFLAGRQEMFVGNFDHELKTPLTSIIGYADMLRSKRMTEEQTVLLANQIFQEGKRLQVMSEKLMQLTVLKRQDFKMRRVSAKRFLTSVYDTVYPAMQADGIRFTAEIQDGKLTIEPDLMKTVCINLLDNARKAIDGAGGQVVLSGKRVKDGYEIGVRDNGCGIPEEELSKISEAFYMVDKARSRGRGGAGLGLAVCTAIMEIHHGQMSYESTPGVGTCVRVFLAEVKRNEAG